MQNNFRIPSRYMCFTFIIMCVYVCALFGKDSWWSGGGVVVVVVLKLPAQLLVL